MEAFSTFFESDEGDHEDVLQISNFIAVSATTFLIDTQKAFVPPCGKESRTFAAFILWEFASF